MMMKKLTTIALALALVACADEPKVSKAASSVAEASAPTSAPQGGVIAITTDNYAPNPDWETYLVGSEISYPPFEFKDKSGQATGFEVELLQAVATAAKINVQFINDSRSDFVDRLDSGAYQIFASTLVINPERAEKVDFSQPYLNYDREIFLLDTPENASLKTIADFKGKRLAINRSAKTALEITGSQDLVTKTNTFYLSLAELYRGNVDGVIGDARTLEYFSEVNKKNHRDIKTRSISLGEKSRGLAFAVKKGNQELLNKLNKGLETIRKDGTLAKLEEKWFKHMKAVEGQE